MARASHSTRLIISSGSNAPALKPLQPIVGGEVEGAAWGGRAGRVDPLEARVISQVDEVQDEISGHWEIDSVRFHVCDIMVWFPRCCYS